MTRSKTEERKTYEFTLILSGQPEPTEEMADALIEAGCTDALLGSHCGVITLDFSRKAPSLRAAITSGMIDVLRANVGLRVVRVEPDELVTASEIATRLGRSKELIRLYALGKRGPGGFPLPMTGVTQKTPLYRWLEVACWIHDKLIGRKAEEMPEFRDFISHTVDDACTIGALNAALELGRYTREPEEVDDIMPFIQIGAGRYIGHTGGSPGGEKDASPAVTRRSVKAPKASS